MKGYGDLEAGGLGYGDLSTSTPIEERGYGSPDSETVFYINSKDSEVYHSGGCEVVIEGVILDQLAPYQASIQSGGTLYFNSGLAGQGFNLYPIRGRLVCYSPPAPVGSYTLLLKFGPNLVHSVNLPLTYVNDNRGVERYRTNRLLPAHYQTGPRSCELDPFDNGAVVPEEPFLISLTDTIGRVFQEIGGAALTITTNHTPRGASTIQVESVYGFKPKGQAFINGELLGYQINGSSLALNHPLKQNVREGAQVKHYV